MPAAADLGSQGYGIRLHGQWYRQTVSHNTVLVSGRAQPPTTGMLLHFAGPDAGASAADEPSERSDTPESRTGTRTAAPEATGRCGAVVVADATAAWSGASAGVYDGVTMRRAIAWRAPYFVDCFHVYCPARRRIDWLLHVHGELREVHGVELHGAVRGRPAAWPWLEAHRAAPISACGRRR